MPAFQALVDYRTGFWFTAPDLDEARRIAQRMALDNVVEKAVIDITQVSIAPPAPSDPPGAAG